jgi:hypothetical protein
MKLPHLKPLCLLITLFSTGAVYALEALEDEVMSESTGEGIAFLPEDFSMVMRGADNTVDAGTGFVLDTDVTTNRAKDTGYVRFIPVGPLTFEAQDTNKDLVINASDLPVGKADIFLYGLAVSRADGNPNSRFNSTDPSITSWGTSDNPWLFKTQTANSIPSFAATGTGDVTYFSFEAPLYHKTPPTTPATGLDAYNLKLALWADAFVRDPSKVEGDVAQFNLGGAGRANRLRLQAIWDGFSVNGSEIRMFQTLDGAVTGTNGMSSFYNNTLGLTGVLRLNSGDTTALRAITTGTATRSVATNMRYTTTSLARPGAAPAADLLYRLRSVDTVDTITGWSWTPPVSMKTLRLSTQECGAGNLNGCTTPVAQGLLDTSAINGTSAPTFAPNEGLNLYSPNFNLILGQLYQPLVVGVAEDHKNLVLEVARIANRQDVYSQIYTRYPGDAGDAGVTYSGSTCNVHQCGTHPSGTSAVISNNYQAKTATHSSIAIGSTNYDAINNLLTADTSAGSVGVSFGGLTSVASTTTTNRYYQLQQQTRLRNTNTQWRYDNALGPAGTIDCNTATGECYEFNVATWNNVASFNQPTIAASYNPTIAHVAQNVTGQTNPVVPAWSALPQASYSGTTWSSTVAPGSPHPTSLNNLGSAVIDGLLIQHLKITTKGL